MCNISIILIGGYFFSVFCFYFLDFAVMYTDLVLLPNCYCLLNECIFGFCYFQDCKMNWSIGRSYPMIGAQSCLQERFVQAMQNVSYVCLLFVWSCCLSI